MVEINCPINMKEKERPGRVHQWYSRPHSMGRIWHSEHQGVNLLTGRRGLGLPDSPAATQRVSFPPRPAKTRTRSSHSQLGMRRRWRSRHPALVPPSGVYTARCSTCRRWSVYLQSGSAAAWNRLEDVHTWDTPGNKNKTVTHGY